VCQKPDEEKLAQAQDLGGCHDRRSPPSPKHLLRAEGTIPELKLRQVEKIAFAERLTPIHAIHHTNGWRSFSIGIPGLVNQGPWTRPTGADGR